MIEISNITKRFGNFVCLDEVSLTVQDGTIYGLVGENGAGKSTLLRLIAGVYRADAGEIRIDGKKASSVSAKKDVFYMPDRQHYERNATPLAVGKFYRNFYSDFSMEDYRYLLEQFGLEEDALVDSFSKGMKKQMFIAVAICANTKYLLCDEVFDGLDPQVRKAVNDILVSAAEGRKLTILVVSHYLEELDKICKEKGYLYRGRILTQEEWGNSSAQDFAFTAKSVRIHELWNESAPSPQGEL